MLLFKANKSKFESIRSTPFKLEKNIQQLTEKNLEEIFGLTFVSGLLNNEFFIRSSDQDFYIDTLAFDESQQSFVIIEYKNTKSFSVIDQGFAYLSAMLNNKADFVLEINEKLNKRFTKKDINWELSRVIFISPEFTNYQKNAINFKDLPIFLYEIKAYEGDLVAYNAIKPIRTSEPITRFTKDKTVSEVTKEVKVYDLDSLLKPDWEETKDLLEEFEKNLAKTKLEYKTKYNKHYIAYVSKHGRNFTEIILQKQGLKIYYRFKHDYCKSSLKLTDCSKIGHWTNGNCFAQITNISQISEAVRLAQESYNFFHRDILNKN